MTGEYIEPSKSQKWTVYCKLKCPNCDKIKYLLEGEDVVFYYCDNWLNEDRLGFLEWINELSETNIKSFPIIFKYGKYLTYKEVFEQFNF